MITERAAERVEVSPKSVKEARIEQSIASLISFVEEQLPSQNHFRIGQREAFGEIAKFLKSGNRKGYILHPTGYGKTLVLNQTGEVVNPTKEVIITPLVDGLFQLKEERQKLNPNREIGLVYAESKEFDKPIVIITINSFMALVNRVNKGDLSWRDNLINLVNAELVFLDEAHRYLTKKRIAALKLFALQGHGESILIGATATDFYSRNKNLELLFGPKIHEVSTMDAIEEGALVSARGVMVKVDLSLDKIGTIETKFGRDFSSVALERGLDLAIGDKIVLTEYKRRLEGDLRFRPTIAYCVSRAHARAFVKRAEEFGYQADFITGEMRIAQRKAVWQKLESGKVQIIAAVDLVNETINKPYLEVGLGLRPTASRVLATQRFGRLLRPSFETAKQFAYWFELVYEGTTLRNSAQVTVWDLYQKRYFRNGAVFTTREEESPKRVQRRLGEVEDFAKQIEMAGRKLDGVEIDANIEEIPIFGGIDTRLSLLRQGLLEAEDVEEVRFKIKSALDNIGFRESNLDQIASSFFMGGLNLWFEDQKLTVESLVSNLVGFGEKSLSNSLRLRKFLGFVYGEDVVNALRLGYASENKSYFDPRMRNLVKKVGTGQAIPKEVEKVADFLFEIFELVKAQGFSLKDNGMDVLKQLRVETFEFRGSLALLGTVFEGDVAKGNRLRRETLEKMKKLAY